MVTELKIVIEKVEQLTEAKQHEIARMLEEEVQWDKTLADIQPLLAKQAEEATWEQQSGKTKKIE